LTALPAWVFLQSPTTGITSTITWGQPLDRCVMFTHWLKSAINERDNDGWACEHCGDLLYPSLQLVPDPRNAHMDHL
jgi:hypothetical protein